jgi:hypothetical protein
MLDSASTFAFARLASSGEDCRLFKRYGADRPESMDRTRWHLLLPLDQRESMEMPSLRQDSSGLALDWIVEERVYSLEFLTKIAEATERLFDAQQAKGAKAKGLPVSRMHAIELRLQGEPVRDEDLERVGTIFGVHVDAGAGQHLGGLYALIEWTPKAWSQIEDGTWHDLSIALAEDYRLADGSTIEGECMFAAALVDVGFFEAIPSARDGLPVEAFTSPSETTIATYRRAISRRLHSRNETMQVNLRMDDAMLEQIKALIGEALAEHVEMLHSMHTKICALDEQMTKMRDMTAEDGIAEDVEDEGEDEGEEAVEMAAATATTTMSAAATAEAVATRIAAKVAPYGEAKIAEAVQAHVEAGRLLPAHVRAYALALAKGERDVAQSMLGDFTGLAARSGSSHAASAPVVETRSRTVSAADIVKAIESEGKHRKGTQAFVAEMYSRIDRARASGILV